jgi:hypothetical protein
MVGICLTARLRTDARQRLAPRTANVRRLKTTVTKRRALTFILGGIVLSGAAYSAYIFLSAESRVRSACAQIKPGTSVASLRTFAEQRGMRKPTRENGVDFVVETKSFGRFGCMVTMESGVVRKVKYGFAD